MNNSDYLGMVGLGLIALAIAAKSKNECWDDGTIECLDNPTTCNQVI